jgi:FtsP/CotA-like multicopper oxidase with cupredoxin domain
MRDAVRTITVAGVAVAGAAVGEHLASFGPVTGPRHLLHLGGTALLALVPAWVAAVCGTRRGRGPVAGTATGVAVFALLFLPLSWLLRRPDAVPPAGGDGHAGHGGALAAQPGTGTLPAAVGSALAGVALAALLIAAVLILSRRDGARARPWRRTAAAAGAALLGATLTIVVLDQPAVAVTPFTRTFVKPAEITGDTVDLVARQTDVQILDGAPTRMLTYNGTFPGPTIRRQSGQRTTIRLVNDVPRRDPAGPLPAGHPRPDALSLHHHGAHSAPEFDGHPTRNVVDRGRALEYRYEHREEGGPERAAFQWYHDHVMDHTAENVWRGLAGMFILEDDVERALPLPRGDRDLPMMITDRTFDAGNQLTYRFDSRGVRGDQSLINGVPQPRAAVATRKYRLRLLNASNIRSYRLRLEKVGDQGVQLPMTQIATESGLLPSPVVRNEIYLAPAERVEVVVDFAGRTLGERFILKNEGETAPALRDLMRFDVATRDTTVDPAVPARLRPLPGWAAQVPRDGGFDRVFRFEQTNAPDGTAVWTINGQPFDPNAPIPTTPAVNRIERWKLVNATREEHSVHLHDVDWLMVGSNSSRPRQSDGEAGLKETFRLAPNEDIVVAARFNDHTGVYIYHCHVLEHEDRAMMAQFAVQ